MKFEFGKQYQDAASIPEQFRVLYAQGEDESWSLNPEMAGVTEALIGLNKSLTASRGEAKKYKGSADLSALSEWGESPAEIAASFASKVEELETSLAGSKDAKINLDKVRADLAAGHAKDLESYKTRNGALQSQLHNLLVTNEATQAIASAKGSAKMLMPHVHSRVKVVEDDGKVMAMVVDEVGERRYSGVTGNPMTVAELVAEMKGDSEFSRAFDSEAPKGGGTPPGSSTGAGVRRPAAQKSSVQKIADNLPGRS